MKTKKITSIKISQPTWQQYMHLYLESYVVLRKKAWGPKAKQSDRDAYDDLCRQLNECALAADNWNSLHP